MSVNIVNLGLTEQNIPPSMKRYLEINPNCVHTAECAHDIMEGLCSGIDADEYEVLVKLKPELKEQYEAMANSDVNKENLQKDIDLASYRVENAQKNYDEKNKDANNWFLNIFRSKDTKEKLHEEATKAQRDLEYAQLEYDAYSKNVISYETILQRNGGMNFGNEQPVETPDKKKEPAVINTPKPTTNATTDKIQPAVTPAPKSPDDADSTLNQQPKPTSPPRQVFK